MGTDKPRVYLDACCFIDMVKHDARTLNDAGRVNDVWYLKKILEAHRAKDLVAYTSTLSVTECVSIQEGQREVPEGVKDKFRRLLSSGQFVILVQTTPFVSESGRDLRWDHGIVLGGNDATHIACAIEQKCEEFITTDKRIHREKIQKAIPVLAKLGLKVIRASQTEALPFESRQGELMIENDNQDQKN